MSNYILLYLVFVNTLYHRAPLSTDYLGNLSFTLQPELCPDRKNKTLKKLKMLYEEKNEAVNGEKRSADWQGRSGYYVIKKKRN